jgi:pimeloyl-ACP methyl ester carboxylesterase
MKNQTIKQAKMAYRDEGTGFPLLFGHSFLWDARMWQAQIADLKNSYRCVAPDLWSHGQSDPLPDHDCSLEILAEDYWQFAQSLSLQKFALVGLSVGGMWAAHLALTHPEAISALVLMDTYVGSEPDATKTTYLNLLDEMRINNKITSQFARKVAPYFFGKTTQKEQPELVENFIDYLSAAPAEHIIGKVNLGKAIFNRQSLLENLKNIRVPTLIIVGEEDLPRPPHEAREMADLIPHAQLEIVPKAGHICTIEQPDYVNKVLCRFLTKAQDGQ